MIHLIRRFLNTGNTPLNTLISSVQNTVNTINTNAANLNNRLTATRAGYLDYLANSTYGLSAIKTQAVANQNWYAKYGTSTTLASKTTATSATSTKIEDGKSISILTFDVPEDGIYYFELNGLDVGISNTPGGTTHDSQYYNYLYIRLKNVPMIYYADASNTITDTQNRTVEICPSNPHNTPGTGVTKKVYVRLPKGMRFVLEVYTHNNTGGYKWIKCSSAYVKYIKQTI